MRVQIKLDQKSISKLQDACIRAGSKTMEALKSEVVSAAVMPFDLGDMQNNQTFTDYKRESKDVARLSLVTGSPQARRLYYHPEYNFQTVNNANAGGMWLSPWISGDKKDFVRNVFESEIKKEQQS